MYADNDLMFPRHVIPSLRNLRGDAWKSLVDRVASLPECHEETLAFMYMMIQLNGCLSCETDSFRAMRGCAVCAQQTLRRYKGSEEELLGLFNTALDDVRAFACKGKFAGQIVKMATTPRPAIPAPVSAVAS